MPRLPAPADRDRRPDPGRVRRPLLAAAAIVLVAGVLALVLARQDGGAPQPAPAPGPDHVSRSAPRVPYVLDLRLYVDGSPVPGEWASVQSRGGVWLAVRTDGSWWWGGPGVGPARIDARLDQPPAISPRGGYIAFIDTSGGTPRLTGFDTQPAGEGFGAAPVDLPRTEDGVAPRVRAVDDDGDVVVQGTSISFLWRAQVGDGRTVVDLSRTAPHQVVLEGTPAGLAVVDGSDGAVDASSAPAYLADLSPDGRLTRRGTLPSYDGLEVSPGGTWSVGAPAGSLGGEVASVSTLEARPVGEGDAVTVDAPEGWGFASSRWAWEDDRTLISTMVPGDGNGGSARLARCDVVLATCRMIADARTVEPPAPDATATGATATASTAAQTLEQVVRAAATGDRSALPDPSVIADGEWQQLRGYAAGAGGSVGPCRDNGGGTRDCEIRLDADPATTYYAIVEPAPNGDGWRVSYIGVGGA